jgi:acetoin utilization protein AcuB
MIVRNHMTPAPVTILPTASVEDALHLMREKNIRHLPVLDFQDKLVGFVSEYDLAHVAPSPVASLSIHDMMYQMSRLKVQEIMVREVVTIDADCPLEEAAVLMVDQRVNALPVLDKGELIGIITETDIFAMFLEMLDTPISVVRMTLVIPNQKGMIASLCRRIAAAGGNITSLGTFLGPAPDTYLLIMKVGETPAAQLEQFVKECGFTLVDMREEIPAEPHPNYHAD